MTRCTLCAERLLEPAALGRRLARFARGYEPQHRAAIASIWTKAYLRALVPAALGPALSGSPRDPSLAAAHTVLDGDTPVGFRLGAGTEADAFHRLLVEGHLRPLASVVAALSGLAPRVVWSNAGNYLAHALNEAEHVPAALVLRRAMLEARHLPWSGALNPLFEPVRPLVPPQGCDRLAMRRVCCVQYLAGMELCGSCPRLLATDGLERVRPRASKQTPRL